MKRSSSKLVKALSLGAIALLGAAGLAACSSNSESTASSDSTTTVKIGTIDASSATWQAFEEKAAEEGITLETTDFSAYASPNAAVSEGQIDVNLFQHLKFLAQYNVASNDDLVPIGSTEVVPLALYWKDHDSLDGIDGQAVAIPSDSTNQGRAINVLVQAGLLTLKEDNLLTPTPADIDEAQSRVTVTPVEGAQTSTAWNEGRPAIINNTFLNRAGIDPTSAVFADDPNSTAAEPYINAFVTTQAKKDDPTLHKLVDIWHSPEVLAAVAADSQGTSVAVTRSEEDLEAILARLEDQIRAEDAS
ncbi:MAG: MetQ/NlpA family ABC transporter substrate-binding protein [Corynebacterium sp.]|nr:MetQ/NlpA family ABC transporter substrate-binding protein [Corynebacterium sp.]